MNKISIKGCQFACQVMGTGSPTVVFETGIGAESSEWGPVASIIARSNAVFQCDRAGRGASDPGQGNRDAMTMVDELNELLEATQTKGPYLLVGHSLYYFRRNCGRVRSSPYWVLKAMARRATSARLSWPRI